ncbi:hypothetical protein CHS0354_032854 [Potamilus streckersoni]|uniref:t-SNARE coiled-coil homology domain-containing protein n=1 Tax=Potamilus streckersoni TaxID=2493646 RepID=A0AAE0S956_9BIVA|nr:hypothetical protein CHS0354_032854 [Potamilus streckersoni]
MSKYSNSSNPFYERNDEYDIKREMSHPQNPWDPQEDGKRRIQEQIEASESRQLESSARALASLNESESMGIATAEELLRQGEQLDNIENKTRSINQSLTTSQKHLNSVKSIFGGIKNWWQGDKEKNPLPASKPEARPSQLRSNIEKSKEAGQHPALRLRSEDYRGFYEEDDVSDRRFLQGARKLEEPSTSEPILRSVTHSEKEKETDKNLEMIAGGLTRLKGLAINLGDEIEKQNEQLDRIDPLVERANIKMTDQNKQMRHILK